ncbi:protein involved in polysaccharide export with SLBB domain [Duganella sp. 3397]|uniref:SLBB domain-containing protein n=1 Tax=Duganella sp. 3397 TaxID=2817732 RepID=UPI00286420EA|nr:SLBB domain-containing protein [Duganella sp. 3397]MDR7052272.1 protein involved in polysaccharide export with SLBB domain [Duganella sp. 3397]
MKNFFCQIPRVVHKLVFSASLLAALVPVVHAQEVGPEQSDMQEVQRKTQSRIGGFGLPSITGSESDRRASSDKKPDFRTATDRTSIAVPRDAGEFEKYIEAVTNEKLQIFGSDLFSTVPTTFAPADAGQVNQDYVLGTGDVVQIRGWGMVDIDVSATVDRSGAIYIPRIGNVNVSGVKYRDLQGYLKQAVGKVFTNFELTASISQVRSVQIYVVGHAVRPGTYTLSAMSTLLNALFTSGGPSVTGTLRNIEVKRANRTATRFDLYDMLVKGDKSSDLTLQDGDVVYIPEVGPLVALTGNVKTPAIFELKKEVESVSDLVALAGGFSSSAQTKQIVVEKNINNNFVAVANLTADAASLSSTLSQVTVRAADVLRVYSPGAVAVEAEVSNAYVKVSGAVNETGVFKIRDGETLRGLISRLGGVKGDAYVYATELNRESLRLIQQRKLNEVSQRFMRDLESAASKQLGSTADAGNAALINASLERQRAIAQRMASVKAKGRIVLELTDGDVQIKNLPEVKLRDGDSIYIPKRLDTVDVLGAVFQQNTFIYRPSRKVGDYIALAGGTSQTSDPSQIYVIRADGTTAGGGNSSWFSGTKSLKVNPGDTIVVPEEIAHSSWMQSFKEWTTIFYQFGLGAAGLKVLKD